MRWLRYVLAHRMYTDRYLLVDLAGWAQLEGMPEMQIQESGEPWRLISLACLWGRVRHSSCVFRRLQQMSAVHSSIKGMLKYLNFSKQFGKHDKIIRNRRGVRITHLQSRRRRGR
ncbi:hypothetical protein EV356DRAFT_145407 [Viridothelium virens]|uniref:Uncharacterized protein n=1 Tax=Viridothelium virens TaxID=1048519 RepID=A0A6A6H961_VIRVR|nr:hypothetical protein EV356DRAFT_145407 [Viridothelium virens]